MAVLEVLHERRLVHRAEVAVVAAEVPVPQVDVSLQGEEEAPAQPALHAQEGPPVTGPVDLGVGGPGAPGQEVLQDLRPPLSRPEATGALVRLHGLALGQGKAAGRTDGLVRAPQVSAQFHLSACGEVAHVAGERPVHLLPVVVHGLSGLGYESAEVAKQLVVRTIPGKTKKAEQIIALSLSGNDFFFIYLGG